MRARRLRGRLSEAGVNAGWIGGSDVERDNGRGGLSQKCPARAAQGGPLLRRLPTELAKQGERVKPGRVPAFERDLQRVLTDQSHVFDPELSGIEVLDASQASRSTGLTTTLGAWASPPELLAGVGAPASVLPADLHDLALPVDVDVERKGIRVSQSGPPSGR